MITPTTKEINAVKEYIELETVSAFVIMKKHYIEPDRFWCAYRYVKGEK